MILLANLSYWQIDPIKIAISFSPEKKPSFLPTIRRDTFFAFSTFSLEKPSKNWKFFSLEILIFINTIYKYVSFEFLQFIEKIQRTFQVRNLAQHGYRLRRWSCLELCYKVPSSKRSQRAQQKTQVRRHQKFRQRTPRNFIQRKTANWKALRSLQKRGGNCHYWIQSLDRWVQRQAIQQWISHEFFKDFEIIWSTHCFRLRRSKKTKLFKNQQKCPKIRSASQKSSTRKSSATSAPKTC